MNVGQLQLLWTLRLLGDGDKSDVLIFTSSLLVKKLAIKLHLSGGGLSCIEMQGGGSIE